MKTPSTAAALALLTFACVASQAEAANPYGPAFKSCGSFETKYHVRVYATHMPCRKALRIQKEYWRGPESRKTIVNGGTGCCGYILLKRFPGWKCTSGAGGGACTKGPKVAAYSDGP